MNSGLLFAWYLLRFACPLGAGRSAAPPLAYGPLGRGAQCALSDKRGPPPFLERYSKGASKPKGVARGRAIEAPGRLGP